MRPKQQDQIEDVRAFIEENSSWITDVLRYSSDPYVRACALALLTSSGSEREIELIERELEAAKRTIEG